MKLFHRIFIVAITLAALAAGGVVLFASPPSHAQAKVVIVASRGIRFEIITTAMTIQEVLDEQRMETSGATVNPPLDSRLASGMEITYTQPVDISIADAGVLQNRKTTVLTVAEALAEAGIVIYEHDIVQPSIASLIGRGTHIVIQRINIIEERTTGEIPFPVVRNQDSERLYGTETVVEPGQPGKREVVWRIILKNGAEISRTKISATIISKPLRRLVRIGAKIVVEARESGRASWYDYKLCLCAAHPSYPKGSFVRVTAANGRSVIVQINDRGPDRSIFPDRIIDLDRTAFEKLATVGAGTLAVTVEKLKSP